MKFLSILTVSLWSVIAVAAPARLSFNKIGLQQGLPHATVNSIAFDRKGNLWVATPDGISRFDSYTFTNYDPFAGLTSNQPGIKYVAMAGNDIYAGAGNVLFRYDGRTDAFEAHELPERDITIRTFISDSDSTIVLGTDKGVLKYNITNKSFRRIIPELTGAVNDIEILDGSLYFGMGRHGLDKADKDGGVQNLSLPPNTDVNTLFVKDNTMLIGTEGHGIFRYTPATGALTSFPAIPADSHVRALAADDSGNLWIGTFKGLYVIDPDGKMRKDVPAGDDGISHPSVRAICPDSQGGIWLGTFFGGLNYYNPLNNQVSSLRKGSQSGRSLNDNIVSVMVEDKAGRIWIGTNNGGVNIYDPSDGTFKYYTTADGLGSNDVKAIYLDEKSSKAYIGTHIGAMTVLDITTGKMKSANVPSRNVFAIEPTLDGRLWLNAFSCLFIYNPITGEISEPVDIMSRGKELKRSTGLYRDSENRLWVYGEDGLAIFKEHNGQLTTIKFLSDSFLDNMPGILDVFQDTGRRIWLATNNGLWAFDSAGKELGHLTEADGIPSHIVNALTEDPSGKIWATTNRGVVRVNPLNNQTESFSSYDNSGNNLLAVRSVLNTSNGKMFFGGIDGVRIFNPSILESNPYAPRPQIVGLRLFDKPVRPGDVTGILSESIEVTDNITLNSDQTSFTIEFTVCNYPSAGYNTFYYMLDGLDKQWIPLTKGVRAVTYSNLPPGSYRFLLKAANNDGVMSDEIASLGIKILPVWYKSWWAIILWIAIAIAIVAYVTRTIWHRKMMVAKILMQKADFERQQQAEEMKVRFFVNLSHELRTPLTLMMLPVDELLSRNADPIVTNKLTTVKNNTLRILHIVNQLLDYRRAEMGMFKLKVRAVNINVLIKQIFNSYETMARHKNINYTLDSTVQNPDMMLDRDYLELIVNNLLTNAFKYTPKGQSISVGLESDGQKLKITVSDTGCGIPTDKLDKIFTRFYQVNDTNSGNGIGLSLVKRLVELHHGEITVDSVIGRGTTFSVTLPTGAHAYSAEELNAGKEQTANNFTADNQPYIQIPEMNDRADSADELSENSDVAESNKATVMVVDDNSEILKYIGDSLAEKYNVLLAANGAKAIELLSTEPIDLILTDVMMPDVDGVQLCRAVKRNLRTSHIPVIMLSAKSDISDQMEGLGGGADDYIPKPFSLDLLKAKIRNQLRTRARLIDMYSHSTEIEPSKVAMNPLDEEFLSKAIKVMNEHIDDSQFSTDAFAKEMCMSRSNLHLKMKALTGESTNDFIRRVRLNKAMELLKTSRYNVSEVSAMVGYSTPSYFTTSFKKHFGYSPSELVKKD